MRSSTSFEKWARRMSERARKGITLREIQNLAQIEARRWKQIDNKLRSGMEIVALNGFAGVELTPSPVSQTLVTGGATELLLWPGATVTPTAANPQIPKVYELHAWGTSTTAATPGTFTLNPRIGTTITSPSLGVSAAITPVASATAANWSIKGKLLIRTNGTAAIATGNFEFRQSSTVGGPGPVSATSNCELGGISASFDATIAQALVFGWIVATSTTNTFTPQGVVWGSWN